MVIIMELVSTEIEYFQTTSFTVYKFAQHNIELTTFSFVPFREMYTFECLLFANEKPLFFFGIAYYENG